MNKNKTNICSKTPMERLEIKEFVLDANLYLISNSLLIVVILGSFFYFMNCLLYSDQLILDIGFNLFFISSVYFMMMIVFVVLGFMSIKQQQKYISRLDTVYIDEDDSLKNSSDDSDILIQE